MKFFRECYLLYTLLEKFWRILLFVTDDAIAELICDVMFIAE